MTDMAEDVQDNPTANLAAVSKSTSSNGSDLESSGEEENKKHSFSRTLARAIQTAKGGSARHAAHEAIILKYLAHRARMTKRKDGRRGFYLTLREMGETFPYLGTTTIWEIVHRLKTLKYIEMWNDNKHKYDRTFWYDVPASIRDAAEEDIVYFDSTVAEEVGVPAAVLFSNFQYWHWEHDELIPVCMSPSALATVLPFSKDTIKRGLRQLVVVQRLSIVSKAQAMFVPGSFFAGANPNKGGAKANKGGANPDSRGANPNKTGANPNNDTSYVTISNLLVTSLETHSKPEPAACGSECIPYVQTTHDLSASTQDASRIEADEDDDDEIDSLVDLRIAVRAYKELISTWPADNQALAIAKTKILIHQFLQTLDAEEIHYSYGIEDHDFLVLRFAVKLTDYMHTTLPNMDLAGAIGRLLFATALEAIVGGFLFKKNVLQQYGYYNHGIASLQEETYDCYLAILEAVQQEQERQNLEWLEERRVEFASADESKEDDADLAPAEKARVFRNGINARNEVGWFFWDGEHRMNQISTSKAGWKRAQAFFEENPRLSPADLLSVVDAGMEEFSRRPMPNDYEGPLYWNFKRISDICHLINALDQLVVWLEMAHKLPSITYLKNLDEPETMAA